MTDKSKFIPSLLAKCFAYLHTIRMRQKNVLALEWSNFAEINARSRVIPLRSGNLASVSSCSVFPARTRHVTRIIRPNITKALCQGLTDAVMSRKTETFYVVCILLVRPEWRFVPSLISAEPSTSVPPENKIEFLTKIPLPSVYADVTPGLFLVYRTWQP